jgi:hypothetical protein
MKEQDTRFVCQVAVQGYQWLSGPFESVFDDGITYEEPALVAMGEEWQPSQVPDELFLKFSYLDPASDDAIRNFANANGLLGGFLHWLSLSAPKRAAEKPGTIGGQKNKAIKAEPRSYWRNHIRRMKDAIELWMALKTQNTELLVKRRIQPDQIEYEGPKRRSKPFKFHDSEAITLPDRSVIAKRFKLEDLITPARVYLQNMVDGQLRNYVEHRLHVAPDVKSAGTYAMPTSLIGAMWLQVTKAIGDLSSIRPCDVCGKPMVITPGGYRNNRRSCSNTCRMKIYETRKLEARQLLKEGVLADEIAIRLDTEVAQVLKWTQNTKPSSAPFVESKKAIG